MKHTGRKRFIKRTETGERLTVCRPADPALALKLTEEALAEKDPERASQLFQDIPLHCGPYTFVGFLATDGKVVDTRGRGPIGEVQPGDSFFSEADLAKIPSA